MTLLLYFSMTKLMLGGLAPGPQSQWSILFTQPAFISEPPQVVELSPENRAAEVKPGVTELRVTFDRDMSTQGYSLCGGGPTFPEVIGRPKWIDRRTLVTKVRLKPNHDYRLSLNCQSAQKLRSAEGVPLVPVSWEFSTAAAKSKRSKAEQKKLNKKSLKQLMKLLRQEYSYYDHRDVDWKAVTKKHRKKIYSASSDRSWVKRAAQMLSEAEDMHLWLKSEGKTTPTHRRNISANFNLEGVRAVLPDLAERNRCVYTARTDENIGYLLIGTLSADRKEDLAQVQSFLEEYKNCSALILDLRPNSGGDETLAKPIAAWFVEGEKVYAKNAYRDVKSETGFGPVLSRTIRGHSPPRRFDKPVAVLMGPANMSSCEAFLLMMKQGKKVTLIGRRSYGSSGNPKPHALDNGVEVFIPSWKAMRPDGRCFEGEGIAPDVKVKAKPVKFSDDDPVLRRALKLLREKTEE